MSRLDRSDGDGSPQRVQLTQGPEAPAQARCAVAGWLGAAGDRASLEDVKLLVSELVTNAVRHTGARGRIEVEMVIAAPRIRVQVSDPGVGFTKPRVGPPPTNAMGGRGLLIVDRVASCWGVTPGSPTRVWFEIG